MDIASELGEAGFRHVFVISEHGAIQHHLALNQASDFFNDTYGGAMVHLTGLSAHFPQPDLSSAEQAENGFDIHAGMDETSALLFLRPDLVGPAYLTAVPQGGATWRDLINRGMQPGWPGYFGSPRLATAARGAASMRANADELSKLALRILDGLDHRTLQRYSTEQLMDEAVRDWDAASAAHGRNIQEQQDSWLRGKGLR
jgi:creatinine amidohydrolase/Fe(II)-dependent formamide hydrolase-like protein